MALALNRYLCNSVIPMMASHAHYFEESDHRSSLLEATLHTVYRLSKCRSLTKNQLDTICDFLLAYARCARVTRLSQTTRLNVCVRCSSQLKPSMMTPLLKKLVHDVPALTDQTIVPLRVRFFSSLRSFSFNDTDVSSRCSPNGTNDAADITVWAQPKKRSV